MGRLLVQVTHGPESPTRSVLALLVASTALQQGHEVAVFLVGDAVNLLREAVLDRLQGLGTGSLRRSFDSVSTSGGDLFASQLSMEARGLSPADVPEQVVLALPAKLVDLLFWADRSVTY